MNTSDIFLIKYEYFRYFLIKYEYFRYFLIKYEYFRHESNMFLLFVREMYYHYTTEASLRWDLNP